MKSGINHYGWEERRKKKGNVLAINIDSAAGASGS